MKLIEPENATRLRDIITALAEHKDATAIRVEVRIVPDSEDPKRGSLQLILTHSLGPKRELELGPVIVQALNAAMNDIRDQHGEGSEK